MSVLEQFSTLYSRFDQQALKGLPDIYDANIVFIDPVSEHKGLPQVTEYFSQLVATTRECHCTIKNTWQVGQTFMLDWDMRYVHPKLNAGKPIHVDGITHLTLGNDKIIYHRDYYDMGQMLYEHVPLMGAMVRAVKNRVVA